MNNEFVYPTIVNIEKNGCCTLVTLNENDTENLQALYPNKNLLERINSKLTDNQYYMLKEMWTDDVINAYKESLKEMENENAF